MQVSRFQLTRHSFLLIKCHLNIKIEEKKLIQKKQNGKDGIEGENKKLHLE